ncbi:ketopantoate reductase PanE/ApbA C terminal-domain-containing protein [Hysterangium stoloniferum]|nr:ketopantoate reductase PanE/ApbA C terminal-domain-containing protein [Hysterangium stoloniferum]
MPDKKDVLVVGFGAVGALYSYILTLSGKVNVTCVARSNYQATLDEGIHIQSKRYGNIPGWRPHRIVKSVLDASDRPYSYVVVTTKALPQITPASSLLGPLLNPQAATLPVFVMLQNGLNVEKDIYSAVKQLGKGEPRVISTALWVGTNILPRNIVDHSHNERMSIGIYRPEYSPRVQNSVEEAIVLQEFANLFEGTTSPITIYDEVQRIKFKKNFWNATFGVCSALMRYPLATFFENAVEEQMISQIRAMMYELLAVGRAMGFDEAALPMELIEDVVAESKSIHKGTGISHRASILLDLEGGRPMEVEVILGEVVRKAKELGVDTPRLDLVYSMLSVIQNQLLSAR